MRGRLLVLTALVALAPLTALSAAAQSYCQYVCVDDSCRLEQSSDVPCGDATPTVLQVSSDPDATACLADPVTMDMVTNTAVVADVGVSTRPTSREWVTATQQDTPTTPTTPPTTPTIPTTPTTPTTPPTTPTTPPATPPTTPAPPPAKQDVLLTGFCKFGNLPENPTERILPALEKAVKDQCGSGINLTSQCMKVNTQSIRNCKVNNKVVISLGVDSDATGFRLETAAVNCFRDWKGDVQCQPVCVDKSKPITTTVEAPGPWPTLPDKIGTYPIGKGDATSAGDYVCNATLYWMCTQKECKPYFVHTPNFTKDQDKDVVTGLAKMICDIIAANKPVAKRMAFSWSH